jgi:hypothetical protein
MNRYLFIATLAFSATVDAQSCTYRPALSCPTGSFVHYAKDCPEEPPTAEGYRFRCDTNPPPAQLSCESAYNVVHCEAWPQSPQLTYRYVYTVLNGVAPGYSSSEFDPILVGNCTGNSARVSVTVIAPNGWSSSAQTIFPCLDDQ